MMIFIQEGKNNMLNTKVSTIISSLKAMISEAYTYYKSLPIYGKVIFIIVLIICKIGPDFIMFPILMKWVRTHSKRTEN